MIKKSKIVFLGAPGTGKGTISQFLKDEYNFIHLSTGNMFRSMIQSKTPLGDKLNSYIQEGKYVPNDITNEVIKSALGTTQEQDINRFLILDGYPRTLEQAQYLDTLIDIDAAILLEPNDLEAIIERLVNRLVCPTCERVFNNKDFDSSASNKLCPNDQTLLISRKDDDRNVITNRITEYQNSIEDVINFYKKKNILYKINANLMPDLIREEILKILKG
ncbi:adenylate kinase family protein [Mycoplasmoides pirum]|uniref:adenylate kinase family protein n=1 Tax=Mycoplasmoides pirum TaxID=2122 RepID=UPI0005622CE9|nr:nucleoside monophosphate kinase [Mycoplasmoides pirum]